eukprot:gene13098-8944_t
MYGVWVLFHIFWLIVVGGLYVRLHGCVCVNVFIRALCLWIGTFTSWVIRCKVYVAMLYSDSITCLLNDVLVMTCCMWFLLIVLPSLSSVMQLCVMQGGFDSLMMFVMICFDLYMGFTKYFILLKLNIITYVLHKITATCFAGFDGLALTFGVLAIAVLADLGFCCSYLGINTTIVIAVGMVRQVLNCNVMIEIVALL